MIDPAEQVELRRLAQFTPLNEGDVVVEFGTFFGRSTFCLAEGLRANSTRGPSNAILAFDSFGCHAAGSFAKYVNTFAETGGALALLDVKGERIDFFDVFRHFMAEFITEGLIVPVRSELADSQMPHDRERSDIVLMHIDSPKHYREFKSILCRFLPRMTVGSHIVFQDFFYHWSASLIAVVECLFEDGLIRPVYTASSSLGVQVVAPIRSKEVVKIDSKMHATDAADLITKAYRRFSVAPIDRRSTFLPRLLLARMQTLCETGRVAEATEVFRSMVGEGYFTSASIQNDLQELTMHNFSIRRLYDLDHPPG
jgi:pentatricopeptide repeat protein